MATKDLTRALDLNGKNTSARRFRAYAFLQKKQWKNAVDDYSKVIEQTPNDLEVHETRGFAYRNLGEYDKAIADFTVVIKRGQKTLKHIADVA